MASKMRPDLSIFTKLQELENIPPVILAASAIIMVFMVGTFDYSTSTQISLATIYLLPVAVAAWFISSNFAIFVSILSIFVWALGGILAGDEDFQLSAFVFWWNGALQFISYLALVGALTALRRLRRSLEERVRARAAVLTQEIAERERLQRELLDISDREQRRIGQDLHDGLCQHLLGAALASQVLSERLRSAAPGEAEGARMIASLIEQGMLLSREYARGLYPLDIGADGLMDALHELARATREQQAVECTFECESPVLVHDADTATHLFRIAQEAVRNAIKHGEARRIVIRLVPLDRGKSLSVEDDGVGIKDGGAETRGMGLRIIRHRSRVIGGTLEIRAREGGGTVVACCFANDAAGGQIPRE